VLADIQDNPGAGGTSDTVGLLRALIAHRAKGAVIDMIVDPEAAAAAHEVGEGALLPCGVGAKIGYAGETPVEANWRVMRVASGDFVGTGPMFGGAKFHIGPMALVTDEDSGVTAVLAAARIQAVDQEQFRHVGIEPSEVPILALKSTVHFRADFQPIAETILVVQSPGAHISDPVEMPYITGTCARGFGCGRWGPNIVERGGNHARWLRPSRISGRERLARGASRRSQHRRARLHDAPDPRPEDHLYGQARP
jgi:microcystin degradation protein MlrC